MPVFMPIIKKVAGGGGGAELNIAYGDIAPEDTSKLWVKTSKPSGVLVSPEVEQAEVYGESCIVLDEVMPVALNSAGCGLVGNKIYILGGTDRDGKAINAVAVYDLETKKFENHAGALGSALTWVKGTVIGTSIYLVGGGSTKTTRSTAIRCFDTETMTITTCATALPESAYGVICRAIGTDLYIMGGRTSTFPTDVYKYDTVSDEIEKVGDLSYNEYMADCVLVGTTFYIVGGSNSASRIAWFDKEKLASGYVDVLKKHSNYSYYFSQCVCGNFGDDYIYLIGGRDLATSTIRFDTITKTSEVLSLEIPEGLRQACHTTVGDKIFIFGGVETTSTSSNPPDALSTNKARVFALNAYAPSIEEGSLYIKPKNKGNIFPLVKAGGFEVEIGVDSVYKGNAEGIGEPVESALYKDGAWTTI